MRARKAPAATETMQERAQKAALEYLQKEAVAKDKYLFAAQWSLRDAADKHGVADKQKVHHYVKIYREEGHAAHIPPPSTPSQKAATTAPDSKRYSEAYKMASNFSKSGLSHRKIAKKVFEKTGVKLSHPTVAKALKKPGKAPVKPGRESKYPFFC